MTAKEETSSEVEKDVLEGTFDNYPGPVLRLNEDATFEALNAAASTLSDRLNGDAGVAVLPSVVQLAVKTRSEGRARTRTFALPDTDRQVEFIMLPQADGTQLMIGRDTTLETSIRSALAESRTRFKELLDIAADFAFETDVDGRISFVSAPGALGYTPEELLGQQPEMLLLAPDTAPSPLPFVADEAVREVEIWMGTRTGDAACVTVSAIPILAEDGTREGTRGIAIDVTGDRFRRTELARMKLRDRLIEHVVGALRTEADPKAMLEAAARALINATAADGCAVQVDGPKHGIPLQDIQIGEVPDVSITQDVLETCAANGPGQYDGKVGMWRYLCSVTDYRGEQNGSVLIWRLEEHGPWNADEPAVLNAIVPQMGVVFRQIADQVNLDALTRTDEVTGLYTRSAFSEDLRREMARSRRYGNHCALLLLDAGGARYDPSRRLDPRAAKRVASILTAETRTYDLACRVSDDVFAVWLDNADAAIAKMRGSGFLESCEAWRVDESQRRASPIAEDAVFAIGIALFSPNGDESLDAMMARADTGMHVAKAREDVSDLAERIVLSDGGDA